MNSQQLLFINLIIVLSLVLFFGFRRLKHKQRFRKATSENGPQETVETAVVAQDAVEVVKEVIIEPPSQIKPKKETIYFVFNGHEWEAHEVLGLQSGVSLEMATRHYQELIKTSDPSTFEFYDAAFTSILKLKRVRI